MSNAHQIAAISVAMLGLLLLSLAVVMLPIGIGFFADVGGDGLGFGPTSVGLLASGVAWIVLGGALVIRRFQISSWLLRSGSTAEDVPTAPGGTIAVGILGLYFLIVGVSALLQRGVLLPVSGSVENVASMTSDVIEIGIGLALVLRGELLLRLWQPGGERAA